MLGYKLNKSFLYANRWTSSSMWPMHKANTKNKTSHSFRMPVLCDFSSLHHHFYQQASNAITTRKKKGNSLCLLPKMNEQMNEWVNEQTKEVEVSYAA